MIVQLGPTDGELLLTLDLNLDEVAKAAYQTYWQNSVYYKNSSAPLPELTEDLKQQWVKSGLAAIEVFYEAFVEKLVADAEAAETARIDETNILD